MMTKNNKDFICSYLDEILPTARCELNYTKDYELVIAVMLSAQTTDKSVNAVTCFLFKDHPTLKSLYQMSVKEIETYIHPLGLYKNKAQHLFDIVHDLVERFKGIVPSDKNLLMSMNGIGNKTANVIRAEIFHIPELPVDTHVARVSKRLGLANIDDNPLQIEEKLKKEFPEEKWIKLHHQFIHFGRYVCTARNPDCKNCKFNKKVCKNPIF